MHKPHKLILFPILGQKNTHKTSSSHKAMVAIINIFLTIDKMTLCNVKEVCIDHNDTPTENYHITVHCAQPSIKAYFKSLFSFSGPQAYCFFKLKPSLSATSRSGLSDQSLLIVIWMCLHLGSMST